MSDIDLTGASQICPTCGRRYPYFDPREFRGAPCFDCEERAKQPTLFEVHMPAAPAPPSREEIDRAMATGAAPSLPPTRTTVYAEHARDLAREHAKGPTRSAHEALTILEERRATLIDHARDIAVALCRAHGTVHGRMVRDQMKREGLLQEDAREYWLGAVFNDPRFVWTGQFVMVRNEERNLHTRAIKLWKLAGVLPEGREETTASDDAGVTR